MTHPIRYWNPLERGFDRMRGMLFEPFDLVKWLVLGFSAWLAGLGGGHGGSGNFGGGSNDLPGHVGRSIESLFDNLFVVSLVGAIGVFVIFLIVLILWLSSRGKFIFLDNVIHDRAAIADPWRQFKRLGNSLFLWRAAFVAIVLAVVAAGALLPAVPAAIISGGSFDDLSIIAMTSWGVFFGLVLVVVVVISLYVSLFLDAFVVPVMYRFDLKATEAWKNVIPWLKAYPGHFILYGFFVLLLTLGFAIISLLACVLTCCIAALPYVGTVILLPIWVTYRIFSLEWLAQFDAGFDFFTPLVGEPVAETVADAEVGE